MINTDIKFRVWDISKGRMIYFNAFEEWGFIDHTKSNTKSSVSDRRFMLSTNPDQYIWMQGSGILDKYDRELFVDDLYKGESGKLFQVKFIHGAFVGGKFKREDDCYPLGWTPFGFDVRMTSVTELVGNVHEDFELFKRFKAQVLE